MELNTKYIVGDVLQVGLASLLIFYFLRGELPESDKPLSLLELTEEMLLFLA